MEPRRGVYQVSAYLCLFAISAALAIYLDGAAVWLRASLVIVASLFLGLLTYALVTTEPQVGPKQSNPKSGWPG